MISREVKGQIVELEPWKNGYGINVVIKESSGSLTLVQFNGHGCPALYRSLKHLMENDENLFSVIVKEGNDDSPSLKAVSFFRHLGTIKQLVKEANGRINIEFDTLDDVVFNDER